MLPFLFEILGPIVVGLNAFGGVPCFPGFDANDRRSSQLRSQKKPFDFAKVIDSGGSLKEIVWTNPVYNTGIWYLAVGGKDGNAADFEIKVVIRGKSNNQKNCAKSKNMYTLLNELCRCY